MRRERFLQRVIDQIEVDRLGRKFRSQVRAKRRARDLPYVEQASESPVSTDKRGGVRASISIVPNSFSKRHSRALGVTSRVRERWRSTVAASSKPDHSDTHVSKGRQDTDTDARFPQISSYQGERNTNGDDQHTVRTTVTTSANHRHVPLKSSGPFYGFKSRPTTPSASQSAHGGDDKGPANLFAWSISTSTNWKRAKTHNELLREKKMLRRKGRQTSQTKLTSLSKLKESQSITTADRIRKALRRAHFYGDDVKRLVIGLW